MDIKSLLQDQETDILIQAVRQSAYNLRLCGALAPSALIKTPDLDLLVEMAHCRTFFDLLGFGQDLEDLLGCKLEICPDELVSTCLRDRLNAEPLPR